MLNQTNNILRIKRKFSCTIAYTSSSSHGNLQMARLVTDLRYGTKFQSKGRWRWWWYTFFFTTITSLNSSLNVHIIHIHITKGIFNIISKLFHKLITNLWYWQSIFTGTNIPSLFLQWWHNHRLFIQYKLIIFLLDRWWLIFHFKAFVRPTHFSLYFTSPQTEIFLWCWFTRPTLY